MNNNTNPSRRVFIKNTAALTAGALLAPGLLSGFRPGKKLMTRTFGKTGFEVTTFGLGGQSSLQWAGPGVDPVGIILKAFHLGVNYFDTSNIYETSQGYYGQAFRRLNLIPGVAGYNESLRKSFFLTSKTHLRRAATLGSDAGVGNRTNGDKNLGAVGDLKRSLSIMFGDGQGAYPKGAYLDMIMIHNLSRAPEIDVLYRGLYEPVASPQETGALAALLDYRDGTNTTGLNPKEEKLIRHIGFSGHLSAPVMMEMIRRDKNNILDGMLVAVNANDLLYRSMQHNVIPLAAAKNMGVVGMKVFADGAMYSKPAMWSDLIEDKQSALIRTVGSPEVPSAPLIQYVLTTPGVHTAIIGITVISDDPLQCQLSQNVLASQIKLKGLTAAQRKDIEQSAAKIKEGATNYFQLKENNLTPPQNVRCSHQKTDGPGSVRFEWDTAYAGKYPVQKYEIKINGKVVSELAHQPQTTLKPFVYQHLPQAGQTLNYTITAIDASGATAESAPMEFRV
jgi:aryl-alcohol dehydrogenase-like predicted oxidoreductase